MVLSRKKLKQKLRSILTESLAANESEVSRKVVEVNPELQIVRELLLTKSRKHKPLERRKRGKSKPLPEDLNDGDGSRDALEVNVDGEDNIENEGFVNLEEKGKDRKRKRGDNGVPKLEDGLHDKEKLSRKKKKEMKWAKKLKKKEKWEKRKMMKKKRSKEMMPENKGNEGVEGQEAKKNGGSIESVIGDSNISEVVVPVQVDESEINKVYVGGIPYYSSEDDIISFFQDCGTVIEMDCMTFPETGKFRGIAILTFKTEGAAKRALALDGADMGGFYLKIQSYRPNRKQQSDFAPEVIKGYNRAYIGNLSWDISEDDLKQLFSNCNISSIRFGTDKETGDFKGYAHVDFSDSASLSIALKLDQNMLCDRPVRIRCAVPRKSGQTVFIPGSIDKKKEGNQVEENSVTNFSSNSSHKKPEGKEVVENSGANADANTGARKSKKKRQTCYECGTPGHLSAECPKKRAGADPAAAS